MLHGICRSFRSRFSLFLRTVHVEAKLKELGLVLPSPPSVKGNYISCQKAGNLIFTAGHLPQPVKGDLVVGKVGKELTTEQGYDAAKLCALNILATLKAEIGDLDKIKQIVKIVGFVNCVDGFQMQPKVMNGASDLFASIFPPEVASRGKHARSAIGTNALPLNAAVEVEAVVEI